MVAADRQGRVYAADGWRPRIQQFDGRGRFLAAWAADGLSGVVVARAVGLAVDRLGGVYASDTAGRVHWFAPDGQVRASWDPGRLVAPAGLALDAHGGLYIADSGGWIAKYCLLTPVAE
jgi:sugar lactone lactonase YvrE